MRIKLMLTLKEYPGFIRYEADNGDYIIYYGTIGHLNVLKRCDIIPRHIVLLFDLKVLSEN
jgi:hypothetical protein